MCWRRVFSTNLSFVFIKAKQTQPSLRATSVQGHKKYFSRFIIFVCCTRNQVGQPKWDAKSWYMYKPSRDMYRTWQPFVRQFLIRVPGLRTFYGAANFLIISTKPRDVFAQVFVETFGITGADASTLVRGKSGHCNIRSLSRTSFVSWCCLAREYRLMGTYAIANQDGMTFRQKGKKFLFM